MCTHLIRLRWKHHITSSDARCLLNSSEDTFSLSLMRFVLYHWTSSSSPRISLFGSCFGCPSLPRHLVRKDLVALMRTDMGVFDLEMSAFWVACGQFRGFFIMSAVSLVRATINFPWFYQGFSVTRIPHALDPKSYIVLSFLWKSKAYPIGIGRKIAYLFPAQGTKKNANQ